MASLELTVQENQPQLIGVEKSAKRPKKEVDDSKRDEWSTEAINFLLDVYEAKWNHRNRGNLKGGDWEDVAVRVSARCGGARAPKTPFQCKNKVASMKQKYRSETLLKGISGSASRWPFFSRMDLMLRVPTREVDGPDGVQVAVTDLRLQEAVPQVESGDSEQEVMRTDQCLYLTGPSQEKIESRDGIGNNRDSNQEDASHTLPQRKESGGQESDTSTPRSKAAHAPGASCKPPNKHPKHLNREMAASIRSFANSILRLEEAKMEMFKDTERLRAELEARRADMELKRTAIMMNTQMQIVRLLSGNARKRKTGKSTNGTPAPNPGVLVSTSQNSPKVHPVGITQKMLSTTVSPPMQTISSATMSPTTGLEQTWHQSKKC